MGLFLVFLVILGGGGYIISFFLEFWGGLDIFPPKLPYLGGGAGKKSKFWGELDEKVMRKFSFGGSSTTELENGGSVDHFYNNWGEAASRGRRPLFFGNPPDDVFGTFP